MKLHIFALAALLSAGTALADPADDQAFDEGAAAMKAGNYPVAYEKFSALFARKPSLDVAANLAIAEVELGKKRDAAEHLSYALSVMPATTPAEVRQRMEKDLADLEKSVGVLTLKCPEGSTLNVNGKVIGIAPVKPVYVEPGVSVVVATHPDGGRGELSVKVSVGETVTTEVTLKHGPKTAPPPSDGPTLWPAFVFGGVGLAGVGAGAALLAIGQGKVGDAETAGSEIAAQGGSCEPVAGPGSDRCAEALDSLESGDALSTGGIVALSVGGAAFVGMAVYLGVALSGGEEPPPVAVVPWMVPGQGGLMIQGGF